MSPIKEVQTPEKRLEKSPSSSMFVSLEVDVTNMEELIQNKVPEREIPKHRVTEELRMQDTSRVRTSRPRLIKPRKLEK